MNAIPQKSNHKIQPAPATSPSPTITKPLHTIEPKAKSVSIKEKPLLLPAPKPIKEKTNHSNRYAIKFGSFSNAQYAEASIKKLKAIGQPAYTQMISTPKGTFTRVYIGPISTKKTAEHIKYDVNKRFNSQSFIVPFST